jgi:hypothetical protein
MKAKSEVYKGIEFIRISNLPVEQKEKITSTITKENIIKILKDESILGDCIQYEHYLEWYNRYKSVRTEENPAVREKIHELKMQIDLQA